MITYQVSVPEAKDFAEFEAQGKWQSHTCVIQFSYLSNTSSVNDTVSIYCFMAVSIDTCHIGD